MLPEKPYVHCFLSLPRNEGFFLSNSLLIQRNSYEKRKAGIIETEKLNGCFKKKRCLNTFFLDQPWFTRGKHVLSSLLYIPASKVVSKSTRLTSCRKYWDWTSDNWSKTMFTDDESIRPLRMSGKGKMRPHWDVNKES